MSSLDVSGELRRRWEAGEAMHVGAVLYERLGAVARADLAANLLSACCDALPDIPPPVEGVLLIACDPARWCEARGAFAGVRKLASQPAPAGIGATVHEALLQVAENAAKVIFNASGRPAPFDHDAGYQLVGCAHALARALSSTDLNERLWDVLVASAASVDYSPADLPGMLVVHAHAGECIVLERSPTPDATWLATQQDERLRHLPADTRWWTLLSLGGGAVLAHEPLLLAIRRATYDDFLQAVYHANASGSRSLALLFPDYAVRAVENSHAKFKF